MVVAVGPSRFLMGDDSDWAYPGDGEGPVHEVALPAFEIDGHAVSNARFAEFVASTGWRTDAERFDWSFVFGGLLPDDFPDTRGRAGRPWWRQVFGADWNHPEVPSPISKGGTTIQSSTSRGTTPPPTAAGRDGSRPKPNGSARRGAAGGRPFPWGSELEPDGEHRMNVFQGEFPHRDTAADGFPDRSRRCLPAQRLRPLQHDRQRLGMVERLLQLDYYQQSSSADSPSGPERDAPGPAWGVLPLPRLLLQAIPGVGPVRQRADQHGQQRGVSLGGRRPAHLMGHGVTALRCGVTRPGLRRPGPGYGPDASVVARR